MSDDHPLNIVLSEDAQRDFMQQLKSIFTQMDRQYDQAADYYQFYCKGCENNCCATRFHHHTLLEHLYLRQGFNQLEAAERKRIQTEAADNRRQIRAADARHQSLRTMCPLNSEGLCLLYAHRPMICRLHGLPHELRKPGRQPVYSPGCDAFNQQCGKKSYYPFDRTPFYRQIAALERELREAAAFNARIKMTVAEMIATF